MPTNISSLEEFELSLSKERLSPYRKHSDVKNDIDLICMYIWNAQLSMSLYPLLEALEISLRNSIHNVIDRVNSVLNFK